MEILNAMSTIYVYCQKQLMVLEYAICNDTI